MGYKESIAIGVGPVLILGVIMYFHIRNNIRDFRNTWPKNRCNPIYMPFANLIDPNITVSSNFSNCTNLFAKSILQHSTDPVYFIFAMFQNVAKDMMGNIQQFMKYISGMGNFVFSFLNVFFAKLSNSFSNFLGLFGRVRDLMKRITASQVYAMFTISTIVDFGVSLFQLMLTIVRAIIIAIFAISLLLMFIFPPLLFGVIPLGAMVGISFCFHPDTPIENKTIKEIHIGDTISGSKVTGVFHMKCVPEVNLYEYNGIVVSGLHIVEHDSKWMYVKDTGCPKYSGVYPEYLVCLNTETNKIKIKDSIFSDYEEVSDPKTLAEIEMLVWGKKVNQTYSCGLFPETKVTLATGKKVCIDMLKIGDVLNEGIVTAIVSLDGSSIEWYSVDGVLVSGNQAIQKDGKLVLAKKVGILQTIKSPNACQIFIDNSSGLFMVDNSLIVRDYPDSHDPAIMESIQKLVMASLNKK